MSHDAPFPVDPVLTGIAMAYRNQRMIADMVLPRLMPFGKKEFKYNKWTKEERFTIPNTRVGRTGRPTQVEFTGEEVDASCIDYGLDQPVPYDDINAAAGTGLDPLANAAESLTDLILLDREVRTAGLVFSAGTYPTGSKTTLSGSTQWSHADSDPVAAIIGASEGMLMRPNVLVLGSATWAKLRVHPLIVKAINPSGADSGVARREAVAELFELSEILVGEGFVNTAKPGQAATMARCWGKHASLIYRDNLAMNQNGRITFGFTGQYLNRIAGSEPDKDIGLRGGEMVRVGETVKEVIAAADCGYFFENAVA